MSTSVVNSDPGAGKIKFNVTAIDTTLTTMRIDILDTPGSNIAGWIASFKSGDVVEVKTALSSGTSSLSVRVTGKPTDRTGWWDVPISYLAGLMPTTDAEVMAVQLNIQGNRTGAPYNYGTAISGDPGAAFFRTNDNVIANTTRLFIDDIDAAGISRTINWGSGSR